MRGPEKQYLFDLCSKKENKCTKVLKNNQKLTQEVNFGLILGISTVFGDFGQITFLSQSDESRGTLLAPE